MQQSYLLPNMATQMVQIGEESGALDAMCAKVADFYEAEVDALVDTLSSLLEPLIMSVLGVLVGGLVVAMYLPIRSEEHTSELQSLMRISYAVFCLKKKNIINHKTI